MTDRYYALTVTLDRDIRDDDALPIIEAIKMIKCVRDVKPLISEPTIYIAQERAKIEIKEKIWGLLKND